jgi:hypothetical protein
MPCSISRSTRATRCREGAGSSSRPRNVAISGSDHRTPAEIPSGDYVPLSQRCGRRADHDNPVLLADQTDSLGHAVENAAEKRLLTARFRFGSFDLLEKLQLTFRRALAFADVVQNPNEQTAARMRDLADGKLDRKPRSPATVPAGAAVTRAGELLREGPSSRY